MTTHVLLSAPSLESVETIEIEPAMVEGARRFYPRNARTYDDPRSHIIIDDAKTLLFHLQPTIRHHRVGAIESLGQRHCQPLLSRVLSDRAKASGAGRGVRAVVAVVRVRSRSGVLRAQGTGRLLRRLRDLLFGAGRHFDCCSERRHCPRTADRLRHPPAARNRPSASRHQDTSGPDGAKNRGQTSAAAVARNHTAGGELRLFSRVGLRGQPSEVSKHRRPSARRARVRRPANS